MGNILEMMRKGRKDRIWRASEGAHSHLEMGWRHVLFFPLIAENKRISKVQRENEVVERKSVSVLWGPSVAVTEEEGREFSGVAFTEYKSCS